MEFDQNNRVVQLCARGMECEGSGKPGEAAAHFMEAWNIAETPLEKFTSAHYVARHQGSVAEKLKWDETALVHALKVEDESVKSTLPSLYLNIGKGHEDLLDFARARQAYQNALSFAGFLPAEGYGNMIRSGIAGGLDRISGKG